MTNTEGGHKSFLLLVAAQKLLQESFIKTWEKNVVDHIEEAETIKTDYQETETILDLLVPI